MIDLIKNETRQFTNFSKFRKFLKSEDKRKRTDFVDFSDWNLTEEGLRIRKKTFPMRDSAMKTLLSTFQMPKTFYYSKAPTDMLIHDVNRMKEEYTSDSVLMVHFVDDEIRAVSNPNLVEILASEVLENSNITSESFYKAAYSDLGIRVLSQDKDQEIKVTKGDVIAIGNELMHSEIGTLSLGASPFLLRLVCTNGAVIRERSPLLNSFSFRLFTSKSKDTILRNFGSALSAISVNTSDLRRTFKIMKEKSIKDLNYGINYANKIRNAIGKENFDLITDLTVKIMDKKKEKVVINEDVSLYTLLDKSTRLAKKFDFLTRRRIENLAGNLITMTANNFLYKGHK